MTLFDCSDLGELIPLHEVPRLLPKRRGKRVHLSTVYRWARPGVRGVRLEVTQVGAQRCTSRDALSRFFARLAGEPQAQRTPAKRQRAIERAERELAEDFGIS